MNNKRLEDGKKVIRLLSELIKQDLRICQIFSNIRQDKDFYNLENDGLLKLLQDKYNDTW